MPKSNENQFIADFNEKQAYDELHVDDTDMLYGILEAVGVAEGIQFGQFDDYTRPENLTLPYTQDGKEPNGMYVTRGDNATYIGNLDLVSEDMLQLVSEHTLNMDVVETNPLPTLSLAHGVEMGYDLQVNIDVNYTRVPEIKNQIAILKDVTTRHALFGTSLPVYRNIVDKISERDAVVAFWVDSAEACFTIEFNGYKSVTLEQQDDGTFSVTDTRPSLPKRTNYDTIHEALQKLKTM